MLAELKARIDPSRAEAIVAEASRSIGAADPGAGGLRLNRGLLAAPVIWACLLMLQNVAVIISARELLAGPGGDDFQGQLRPTMYLAVMKIGLLLAAACVAVSGKGRGRFLVLAGAVLYAFPVGMLIEGPVIGRTFGASALFSVSALISYACVAALVLLWRRSRRQRPPLAESHF